MCGIVGYVGPRVAQDFLLEGLRRLEYRGYDSAGTATITSNNELKVTKSVGRIATLAQEVAADPCDSGIGIGHTRWATHGAATKSNAHPHIGGEKVLAMAHNGVIENFAELRTQLKQKGYKFSSETDTEVVAHLLADILKPKLEAQEKGGAKLTEPRRRGSDQRIHGPFTRPLRPSDHFSPVARLNLCGSPWKPTGNRSWQWRTLLGQRRPATCRVH